MLNLVRDAYISTSHFIIHCFILVIPTIIIFFPQYQGSKDAFRLIALTIVLYSNSFGYSGLLIAKGEEKKLGFIATTALIINALLSYFLIVFANITFEFVIIPTTIANFIYIYLLTFLGRKKIGLNPSFFATLKDVFPINIFIPFFISLILVFVSAPDIYYLTPLIIFILLNIQKIKRIKKILLEVIVNSQFINI
jgi:hypothetical protein